MKVVYAPQALRDIDEILSFIKVCSPRGAHNVSLAIEHTIRMCALNPRTGSMTDVSNVYRRPLSRYRYTIFYRALAGGDGIEVARVIHGARVRNLNEMPK